MSALELVDLVPAAQERHQHREPAVAHVGDDLPAGNAISASEAI
jgi:hypothetical protein